MIHASVDGKHTYDIETGSSFTGGQGSALVNGNEVRWDAISGSPGRFHLLIENRSYNVELVEVDRPQKTIRLKVNGNLHTVSLKDRFDDLLKSLGMDSSSTVRLKDIKAPMPGLVLNVFVGEGQEVEKDAPLVILEAMKMENVIKSPAGGVVKRIAVNKGQAVEKNAILIEFN